MTAQWVDVEYTSEAVADRRAQDLITTLERSFSNGRVLLRRFLPRDPETFSAACRRNLRGHEHLLGTFLRSPSVQDTLGDLAVQSCSAIPPPFRSLGAFEFEGALTHTLIAGFPKKRHASSHAILSSAVLPSIVSKPAFFQ